MRDVWSVITATSKLVNWHFKYAHKNYLGDISFISVPRNIINLARYSDICS